MNHLSLFMGAASFSVGLSYLILRYVAGNEFGGMNGRYDYLGVEVPMVKVAAVLAVVGAVLLTRWFLLRRSRSGRRKTSPSSKPQSPPSPK
jgi:hypothetical protein